MWIKISEYAAKNGVTNAALNYQLRQQGIPVHRTGVSNYIREADVNRASALISKLKMLEAKRNNPDEFVRQKREYAKREYANKKLKAIGLPPLPKLPFSKPIKPKYTPVDVVFEYEDRIKRGTIIGGNVTNPEKVVVLIRYMDKNGFKSIASVRPSAVRLDEKAVIDAIKEVHKRKIS